MPTAGMPPARANWKENNVENIGQLNVLTNQMPERYLTAMQMLIPKCFFLTCPYIFVLNGTCSISLVTVGTL